MGLVLHQSVTLVLDPTSTFLPLETLIQYELKNCPRSDSLQMDGKSPPGDIFQDKMFIAWSSVEMHHDRLDAANIPCDALYQRDNVTGCCLELCD
ncbi:hypothetical protein QX201_010146 [Fusarium graminearum]